MTAAELPGELSLPGMARRIGCPSWEVARLRLGYHLEVPDWQEPILVEEIQGMVFCRLEAPPCFLPRLNFPATRAIRPEQMAYPPIRALFDHVPIGA